MCCCRSRRDEVCLYVRVEASVEADGVVETVNECVSSLSKDWRGERDILRARRGDEGERRWGRASARLKRVHAVVQCQRVEGQRKSSEAPDSQTASPRPSIDSAILLILPSPSSPMTC